VAGKVLAKDLIGRAAHGKGRYRDLSLTYLNQYTQCYISSLGRSPDLVGRA
jgi:hypothetical protein